jgi:hypothetical protein
MPSYVATLEMKADILTMIIPWFYFCSFENDDWDQSSLSIMELSDWLLLSSNYVIGQMAKTIVYCIFMHENDERSLPERGLHIDSYLSYDCATCRYF